MSMVSETWLIRIFFNQFVGTSIKINFSPLNVPPSLPIAIGTSPRGEGD
jgi:hypothetical protein